MIAPLRNLLAILFLAQFLICHALAQGEDVSTEEASAEDTGVGHDVSETIKEGEGVILKQKQQLEEKKKSEEEEAEELKTVEEEARREIYEQKIVEEAAMTQSMTMLERQLQREKFRRDIMASAGREAEIPFKVRKKFNLKVSETYDDNIFLTKVDKKNDYITRLSPSVLVSLSSPFVILDANYVMDIVRYNENDKQSGLSHLFLTYIRPGTLALPFFNRRRGKIGLEIQNEFQPLVTNVASSEQATRTERTSNRFFLSADYYMSAKRTLALEYTNIFQNYRGSTLQNYSYTEHIISPKFYLHIRPRWSLFTGYDYGIVDYSKGTNSSTYQRLKTGLTGTIFNKVLANLETGKEWHKYEDSANGQAQKLFFKSALINRFTPATSSSLQYSHSLVESIYGANPYYMSDTINFTIEHKFTYKTAGSFGLDLIHNSYDRDTIEDGVTQKRQDNIWQPALGLKYYFKKWIYTIWNYTYKKRTSNFGKFDYVDNVITGGVNVQF